MPIKDSGASLLTPSIAMAKIRIVAKQAVKPAWPAPEPSLFLSAADLLFRTFPRNRRILFYKLGDAHQYARVLQRLRESLSVALAHFYPLAGRLRKPSEDDEQMGRRLFLDCSDAGAELVEAFIEGVSFEELQLCDFEDSQALFMQLAPWVNPADHAIVPCLSIQVSKFECGSIALGIACSHVVCDGTSLWHFMTSWAECARGKEISVPPVHTRTLLKIENPSSKQAFLLGKRAKENLDKPKTKVELKLFHFNKEMVSRLKEKAGRNRSLYEAMCAHIWKHTSLATDHPREKEVRFIHVVNMRKRLDTPLPEGYFGNAVMCIDTFATAGALEDEGLEKIANRIHDSIASCDDLAFKGFLHWLEVFDIDEFFARYMILDETAIRVSSSPRFPIFQVDFGWGAPIAIRIPSIEHCHKITFFPGVDGFGSIDATLALPHYIVHTLTSNHAFTNP